MVEELELLAALTGFLARDGPGVARGAGDDAAVLESGARVVLAVDTVVDGVHVDRRLSTPADVGFKALAVNVSDLAAMGALPEAAVVSLQLPSATPRDEAVELYEGLAQAAERWDCALVGGDTVTSPTLAVSVTVLGRLVDDGVVLRRDAARPGELVIVIGGLGLAAAGLELLRQQEHDVLEAHPELAAAHRRPVALTEAVAPLVLAGARAAIDVSDGLGRDLGHVAEASGVGIRLARERLPRAPGVLAAAERLGLSAESLILAGGEDQALAVTLPPERLGRLDVALDGVGLRAAVVGEVVEGHGVDLDGRDIAGQGWEHR